MYDRPMMSGTMQDNTVNHPRDEIPTAVAERLVSKARTRRQVEDADYAAAARRFLRALGRRAGANLVTLPALAEMAELIDEQLTLAVHELRGNKDAPASWAQIGDALGITRQAAQQRFGGGGTRQVGGQPGNLR